jgi:Mrp family chromosome partitioning ATPase
MFTSPGDGEGKTSTLASLAVVLAERGEEEIAAVDANLRSPTLGNRLGIWAARGLVDVLAGEADWRELMRKTGVARLSVLPAGQLPSNHDSPSTESKLASVLDALRTRYRVVLIDAPSLAHPEVAPWSRFCDGTYLVAELGQTGRRAARHAVHLIERSGGRVLGCVLVSPSPAA